MKNIIFYLDGNYPEDKTVHSYDITKFYIEKDIENLHTTSLANIGFYLIDKGYNIFIERDNKFLKMYPGMPCKYGKEIRSGHFIERLIKANIFDNDDWDWKDSIDLRKV